MNESPLSGVARRAMAQMAVDRVTAEIFDALDAAAVPARLLKGPSIASWLYDASDERPYGDTDLLIPAQREGDAERVLRELGFTPSAGTGEPDPEGVALNHIWARGSDMAELHVSLVGIRTPRDAVWTALSSQPEELVVGGRPVPVLARPARALHLALHAAQHGRAEEKPLEDLRRGIAREPEPTWTSAAALARELDAAGAFAVGLELVAPGLAARLGVPDAHDADAALRAANEDLALGFGRLSKLPTRRAKVLRLVRVAFPAPAFMRWWSPLARRGALGLTVSYAWRIVWLLWKSPSALRAWRQANQ